MEKFLSAETLILELLLIVTVVAIAVRQVKVPYTVALVPEIEAEELDTVLRQALRVQRSAVIGLHPHGIISDDTWSRLSLEIDDALSAEEADLYKQVFGVNLSPKEK